MRRCADFCCDGRNPAEFMLPEIELHRLTPDSPQRSIPSRLEYPGGGLLLHTQGGRDFCLYRRRFGVAPKHRQPLSAARGPPEVPTDTPSRTIRRVVGSYAAQSETFGVFLPQPWSWSLFGRAVRSSGVSFRRKVTRKCRHRPGYGSSKCRPDHPAAASARRILLPMDRTTVMTIIGRSFRSLRARHFSPASQALRRELRSIRSTGFPHRSTR